MRKNKIKGKDFVFYFDELMQPWVKVFGINKVPLHATFAAVALRCCIWVATL